MSSDSEDDRPLVQRVVPKKGEKEEIPVVKKPAIDSDDSDDDVPIAARASQAPSKPRKSIPV